MTGDDWREPLRWMSGDLTAWEWAEVLDVEPSEVLGFCQAAGLPLRAPRTSAEQAATGGVLRRRVRALESLLDDVLGVA